MRQRELNLYAVDREAEAAEREAKAKALRKKKLEDIGFMILVPVAFFGVLAFYVLVSGL